MIDAMARFLWVACAEPGSLYPAVPIALELERRGHDVTVLCDPAARPTFESLGFGFRATSELPATLASFDAAAYGGGRDARLAWHAGYVRALYADTAAALSTGAFDAVMVDPLEPGADFAAEAAGIPSFSYVHWRMDETGADVPFCFRFWDRERPAADAFVDWWNEQRALVGLDAEPRPPQEHRWYRSSRALTLILGLPELVEPKGDLPAYAVRVGPTVWEPPLQQPLPEWIDELGREVPAVLASVSTVGAADAELATVVGEAVAGEEVTVVLTVPTNGRLPPLPANVRTLPFIPHGALLPRVAAVVSHAGNGTVTRAACAGVPLLLFPGGKDQHQVARGATAAGIALALDRAEADPAHVRTALRRLLNEPSFHEQAQRVARDAAAYDAPATAADAVARLLGFESRSAGDFPPSRDARAPRGGAH
jgi:UDP:flavonoid glycosyltransferase YjiC (YdhE family)